MSRAYYNEQDPFAAAWLRELIKEGLIADGDVDERSIVDVAADDVRGFTQCHWFAGIGGWSYALRLAGWPDDRPVWSGSCPCQPFSVAGKGDGEDDARHLWPIWFRLIRQCAPAVVFGEQVASGDGRVWLARVHRDLETAAYSFGAADLCAAGVSAPHARQRHFFVADSSGARRQQVSNGSSRHEGQNGRESHGDQVAASDGEGHREGLADADGPEWRSQAKGRRDVFDWSDTGRQKAAGGRGLRRADGALVAAANGYHSQWWSGPLQVGWNAIEAEITRGGRRYRAQWRVEPGLSLLAHGIPNRVGALCGFGNAIVPQVAATFIGAYLTRPE